MPHCGAHGTYLHSLIWSAVLPSTGLPVQLPGAPYWTAQAFSAAHPDRWPDPFAPACGLLRPATIGPAASKGMWRRLDFPSPVARGSLAAQEGTGVLIAYPCASHSWAGISCHLLCHPRLLDRGRKRVGGGSPDFLLWGPGSRSILALESVLQQTVQLEVSSVPREPSLRYLFRAVFLDRNLVAV
ncbi:hypothetical protein P7K49_001963 [Saguinus oedipus]|uniref:Uncharacterized protein n=1 Tax=Saguinus oedipus TaxID=9490 RepID=A0ABQ9WJX2_SAGOE|nr:hypothetical protein P7K49_001963 [Saguinus oedipus]